MRAKEEEFLILNPSDIQTDIIQLKGRRYNEIYDFVKKIINHQFTRRIENGIKGFIFHGEVGTGKTTLAKALAKDMNLPLFFVDGVDIARSLYGQSEKQIGNLFEIASNRKSIILIDDAESVFPTRDWIKGQSWHVAQNNVFFHRLDNVDTSKSCVILTTNRYDLMDKAVKDRLYPIEFEPPNLETLIEIAKTKCAMLGMSSKEVIEELKENKKDYTSVRAVERLIQERYIEEMG
ncbi:MAG: AAA family ATPase [Thermoplasmata archaeon]|nr:AAA family ATPase [Thermoplasmata archaeon]